MAMAISRGSFTRNPLIDLQPSSSRHRSILSQHHQLPVYPDNLLPPAVIGLLSDLKLLADLRHLRAFAKQHIRTTQLRNDLIYCVSFLKHLKESFPGLWPDGILSLQLDQF